MKVIMVLSHYSQFFYFLFQHIGSVGLVTLILKGNASTKKYSMEVIFNCLMPVEQWVKTGITILVRSD